MPRDRYDDEDDRSRRRYDDDDDDRPRGRRRRDDDDDYDRPPPKSGSGMKVVFIVLGIVGVVVVGLVVGGFFAVSKVREAAARMQTSNNMKQIGLGLQNYNDQHIKSPGPFVDPTPGMSGPANPSDRLSWRVELLPYIEQGNLFTGIQRDQAWNSPANQPFTSKPIKTFGDPNDPSDANTRFRCFYDNGALFSSNPKDRVSISAIPDGASNTIMFAESGERVPWAQFNEWAFDPNSPPPSLGHPNRDVILVGMADGSVRFIKKTVSPASLNAAITRAGNDVVGSDFK